MSVMAAPNQNAFNRFIDQFAFSDQVAKGSIHFADRVIEDHGQFVFGEEGANDIEKELAFDFALQGVGQQVFYVFEVDFEDTLFVLEKIVEVFF